MNTLTSRKNRPLSMVLLVLFIVAALIPALYSFILSLFHYQPIRGLLGSPFIGPRNYTHVMGSAPFVRLIINSFLLWLVSLAAALLLGVPVALLCSQIKNRRTAATCAGLLLIPAFIPASAYIAVILKLFSSRIIAQNSTYYLAFALQNLLPGAALIAFAGVAFSLFWRDRGKSALNGSLLGCLSAALLFSFLTLSPSYEASLLSANPLVYAVADTLDHYAYRSSLLQMQVGTGAAAFVIRSVLQLVLAIGPAVVLMLILKKPAMNQPAPFTKQDGPAPGSIVAWIAAIVLAAAALFAVGLPDFSNAAPLIRQILPTVLIALLASFVGFGVCCLLLFGTTGAGLTPTVMTAFLVLGASNAAVAQFLLARQFGLVNTVLATPLAQWLQPSTLLLLLLFALVLQMGRSQTSVILMACAAALLIGAQAVGGFMPQLLFANSPRLLTLGLAFKNIFSGPMGGDAGLQALAYILTVFPCLLLGFGSALLVRQGLIKATMTI